MRRICSDFPGSYWRKLEEKQAYPTEFVAALTKAGLLGALIPEEYGGLGLPLGAAAATLEEIHASRLQRRRLPRADVHHGHACCVTAARSRNRSICRISPPAGCGCRPSA